MCMAVGWSRASELQTLKLANPLWQAAALFGVTGNSASFRVIWGGGGAGLVNIFVRNVYAWQQHPGPCFPAPHVMVSQGVSHDRVLWSSCCLLMDSIPCVSKAEN